MLAKLEKYIFYIFILSIPLQTRKILYSPAWRFNEWLSMFVYLSDIVFIILLLLWLWQWYKSGHKISLKFSVVTRSWLIFFGACLLSLVAAKNLEIGAYQLLKILEFGLLFFYVKNRAISKFGIIQGFNFIIVAGVIQSLIAVAQFFKQSDLGLRYLGESLLSINLAGVAVFFNFLGEKVMRAYGTFPHPNVLAAFLFVAIYALYYVWLYREKNENINRVLAGAYFLMLAGLFLTFSRTIIFFWALGFGLRALIIYFNPKIRVRMWGNPSTKRVLLIILSTTLIFVALFSAAFWPEVLSRVKISSQEEAVQMRVYFAQESLKTGWSLLGSGLGNYIPWLMKKDVHLAAYYYQPVHNIFLLAYAETGILGLIAFLGFLAAIIWQFIKSFNAAKMYNFSFLVLVLSVLGIGLFDHFLWTIQQGRIILWLTLGFLASQSEGNK